MKIERTYNPESLITGNGKLDTFLNDAAEIGLGVMEGEDWRGYGSAPRIPSPREWQAVARKVMTVETAVAIVHLCHLHTVQRVFILSTVDKLRSWVKWSKEAFLGHYAEKAIKKVAPTLAKGIAVFLGYFTRLEEVAEDVEGQLEIQRRIRHAGWAGRGDATDHYFRFGKPQHERASRTVFTRR